MVDLEDLGQDIFVPQGETCVIYCPCLKLAYRKGRWDQSVLRFQGDIR